MLLERFYSDHLAQASYIIACQDSKVAVVIDPNRDVDQYIDFAARRKLTIAFVTETHIHADFVSGARDLARRTGAELLLSGEGGRDWQYAFAGSDGARLLRHGDRIDVGEVQLQIVHTPGHTPEHICFLVTDHGTASAPMGLVSGDFIFAGDVGRPDLLERAANTAGTMDPMARTLFRSLQTTKSLPDYLQIWPGHGAGSACGKSLGAIPSTTLGFERLTNWAFQIDEEDAFVTAVLAGQPEPPKYFAIMKATNRDGPPPGRVGQDFMELDLDALRRAGASGATVVDARQASEFAAGHVPGSLNIPMGNSFATWAGSLVPYDRQVAIIAEDRGRAGRARHVLNLIGLDRVIGWGGPSLLDELRARDGSLPTTEVIDAETLAASPERMIIDVRARTEWDAGHIQDATHGFLGDLAATTRDLPRDTPIALHCAGGSRSATAASLLKANGFTDVVNMEGGYGAWRDAGLPVVDDTQTTANPSHV